MDSNASNLFSYWAGGIALLSTLVSVILFLRTFLPGAQMKVLDELLQETKGLYNTISAEQLFPDENCRIKAHEKLIKLEKTCDILREGTYKATTYAKECLESVQGLSFKIMRRVHDVKKFRAFLITTSQEQKRRRAASVHSETPQALCDCRNAENSLTLTFMPASAGDMCCEAGNHRAENYDSEQKRTMVTSNIVSSEESHFDSSRSTPDFTRSSLLTAVQSSSRWPSFLYWTKAKDNDQWQNLPDCKV